MSPRPASGCHARRPAQKIGRGVLGSLGRTALMELLVEIQTTHLYQPDTDAMQHCPDCGRGGYSPHEEWCLVERVQTITGWRAGHR